MAADIVWTKSGLAPEIIIRNFVSTYYKGKRAIPDARQYYFELIEKELFCDIQNKRDRHEAYKLFIERPILDGGLGTTNEEFIHHFRDFDDVLLKHRELWSKGKVGQGANQYTTKTADSNNVTICKIKRGNSRTYSVQRLKDSGNTELAQKVMAKELSANAAMIQAGLKLPTITVRQEEKDFARALRKLFTNEQIDAICNAAKKM